MQNYVILYLRIPIICKHVRTTRMTFSPPRVCYFCPNRQVVVLSLFFSLLACLVCCVANNNNSERQARPIDFSCILVHLPLLKL